MRRKGEPYLYISLFVKQSLGCCRNRQRKKHFREVGGCSKGLFPTDKLLTALEAFWRHDRLFCSTETAAADVRCVITESHSILH